MLLEFTEPLEVKRDAITPAGVFSGYAARTDSTDVLGDLILRGAFTDSLARWKASGRSVPMLLQHGGAFGGAEDLVPIGQWLDLREDARGLFAEGRLFALDTDKGRYLYEGLRAGALSGLSIGFRPAPGGVKYGSGASEPERTLSAIDLHEISVVTFPAHPDARVQQVKSSVTMRELERDLHRVGYSRRLCRVMSEAAIKALAQQSESESDFAQAASELRTALAALKQR